MVRLKGWATATIVIVAIISSLDCILFAVGSADEHFGPPSSLQDASSVGKTAIPRLKTGNHRTPYEAF